jgi:hypothetical protein
MVDAARDGLRKRLAERDANDFDNLARLRVSLTRKSNISGDEEECSASAPMGLWAHLQERDQCRAFVASLLEEFASGSLLRCLARIDDSSGKFAAPSPETVTVLFDHYEFFVCGDRDDGHPVRRDKAMELLDDVAVRQEHALFL